LVDKSGVSYASGLASLFRLLFGTSFHADFSVIEERRLVDDSQRTFSQSSWAGARAAYGLTKSG
jgi:hypothetical protein